jgi:Leucine-rich repeat (LRR) protein
VKYFIIASLSLFLCNLANSQTLFEEYKDFYAISGGKKDISLYDLKKWGFNDIFEYNQTVLAQHKDSTLVLSKIKYASISFSDSLKLDKVFQDLKLLPNLEYLKIKNISFLNDPVENIKFSEKIVDLKKLKTLDFYGTFDWSFNDVFKTISASSSLKNLMLRSGDHKILLHDNFLQLINLEGLLIAGRYGPDIPERIGTLNKLSTLIISADEYTNGFEELSKIAAAQKIENLGLIYVPFTDNFSDIFTKFNHLKKIYLSGKMLNPTSVFKNIGKQNPIKELYLFNNELVKLPVEIKYFPKLEVFQSVNNELSNRLPTVFYELKNLKVIDIQGSTIAKIEDRIKNLNLLKSLKLSFNAIQIVPPKINELQGLQILELQHNTITALPEDFGYLKNLKTLNISHNTLRKLPNSIALLQNLDRLNVENNDLTALPLGFGNLKNLRYLNLENNAITALPESFSELHRLEKLELQGNKLRMLPDEFGNLEKLKELDLSANLLFSLPESFGNLKNLTQLYLQQNNLAVLPESFGGLNALKKLRIDDERNKQTNNQSDRLIFKISLPDSTQVNIEKSNNIIHLPESFTQLSNLKYLDLSNNINLNETKVLNLLKKASFENYTLILDGCNISTLPQEGWSNLKIETLELNNNQIKIIPNDFKNNRYLENFSILNNPGLFLDTSRRGREEISLLFEEIGILKFEELPKTKKMAMALANVANKKSYSDDFSNVIKYAERAIFIDSIAAFSELYDDSYIEALYKTGDYKKTIKYAETAIVKDTSQNLVFSNSILSNLSYKALAHIKLGEFPKALNDYLLLSEAFYENHWAMAGLLSKKIKNNEKAASYFKNSFENHNNALNENPRDYNEFFGLMETYIVTDNFTIANTKFRTLNFNDLSTKNDKLLYDYFDMILSIIRPKNNNFSLIEKRNKLKTEPISSWNFEPFLFWLETSSLSKIQKDQFLKITNLYTP